jgi:hypothetical protein
MEYDEDLIQMAIEYRIEQLIDEGFDEETARKKAIEEDAILHDIIEDILAEAKYGFEHDGHTE